MADTAADVIDNKEKSRFELPIEGEQKAVASYEVEDGRVILTHTEVPEQFSGQGIGSRLASGVFDAIRASGRRAVPRCPFMRDFLKRHPEYSDIVDG